ncbi:hypothetical protein BH23ACT4_BH23ACT4_09520 [soil metagenome]
MALFGLVEHHQDDAMDALAIVVEAKAPFSPAHLGGSAEEQAMGIDQLETVLFVVAALRAGVLLSIAGPETASLDDCILGFRTSSSLSGFALALDRLPGGIYPYREQTIPPLRISCTPNVLRTLNLLCGQSESG